MRVGVAVVADVVTLLSNGDDVIGEFIHPVAHQKERRFDAAGVQNVEQLRGLFIAPSRVKGDGDLLFAALHAIDRIDLRRRGGLHCLCCRRNGHADGGDACHQADGEGEQRAFCQYQKLHKNPSIYCYMYMEGSVYL